MSNATRKARKRELNAVRERLDSTPKRGKARPALLEQLAGLRYNHLVKTPTPLLDRQISDQYNRLGHATGERSNRGQRKMLDRLKIVAPHLFTEDEG